MSNKKLLILICLLSILPFTASLFSPYLVHTHDGLVHLPRIGAFYKALLDGQLPVRWAGDLNFGYGMPLFIFIYHTPYFFSSLFLLLGLGLVWSFKLSLLVSFLLSGIFMFIFANAFFKDQKKALLVTLLYQFAPFHLIDVTIRGSFGEAFTYSFLPLVLYGLTKFFQTKKIAFLALIAMATGLLVISHNSISLLFFTVCIFFVLFFSPKKKDMLIAVTALGLGLLLSAYYWLPALLEHKYTYGNLFMKDLYRNSFPPFWKLFVPNLFDSKSLRIDNIALQFGIFQTLPIIIALWLLVKNRLKDQSAKKVLIFAFSLIIVSLFFMSRLSLPFWEHISFLRQFQFSWRFLSIVVFATSILGIVYARYLKKRSSLLVIAAFIVLSSLTYWFPKEGYDHVKESYYWNFPLSSTYYGETDVIWSAGPAKSYPKDRIEIIDGKGILGRVSRKSNLQELTVHANTDLMLVSNTQYFPGWRAYVDGKSVPIQFQNQLYRGLITFPVLKGIHVVKVVFEESKIRIFADLLSLGGVVLLTATLIFRKKTV